MIDHYTLHDIAKLTDRFGLSAGVPKGVKPRYNIAPTELAPAIVSREGSPELRMMQWGLVPQNAKDANSVFRYKTFNVKSEKVFSKPSWYKAVRKQRCIIPANGFFMQRSDDGHDETYYFSASDDSILSLAGFYTEWVTPEGSTVHTYTLLTIEANEAMPLPFGRMPVILHTDDEAAWLNIGKQEFSTLVTCMRPYEGAVLSYRKVAVSSSGSKADSIAAIEAI